MSPPVALPTPPLTGGFLPPRARTGPASSEPRPDALLFVLAAVLFTTVWRVQDLFPVLALVRPAILTVGAAVALVALDRTPARRVAALRSRALGLALGLLLLLVIGAPISLSPVGSASYLVIEFIPTVVTAVVVAAAVRSVRDLEFLCLASLAGAALFSLVVLMKGQVDPVTGRLGTVTYYDENDLALVLVASIPLAVLMLRRGNSAGRRVFGLACIAMFVVVVVRSGSRGGFLAFLATTLFLLFRYRAIPRRVRAGVVVGGVLLLLAAGSERYWAILDTILHPKQDYNWAGNNYEGRLEIWKRGISYVAARPITGVGIDAFRVAEGELSDEARLRRRQGLDVKRMVAHDAYLHVAAEGGIPGLVVFVAMGIAAFGALGRVARRGRTVPGDPRLAALAQALIGALLGYAVAAIFLSAQYFTFLYVLIGFVAATEKIARASSPAAA